MRASLRVLPFTLALFTAACGSDNNNGPLTPVAATVSIVPSATGALVSLTETRTATATVRDAAQAVIANAAVTWSSNNAAVATVSGSGATATITAVGNGSALITATSGTVSAQLAVDVTQRFAALTVTPATASLAIGATSTLAATARDARSVTIPGATGTTYASSDRTKAIVDAAGIVTAIAPGTATVTASLTRDGVTATGASAITVTAPASTVAVAEVTGTSSNTFSPTSVTVAVGGIVNYTFAGNHNVTFSTSGAPANVPTASSGTFARTFTTVGTYQYTCTIHAGMNGSVLVQSPSIFAQMNGANERPNAVTTSANGAAVFTRNGATVNYTVAYQGLASAPSGLHIHAIATTATTAGVVVDLAPTPLTSASGVLTGSFTATAIRSIGGQPAISMDSLYVLLQNGSAYVNVHSSAFPGGEIRGQTGTP